VNSYLQKNWFPIFLITGICLHALSLTNGIMEADAALYATIAKHIALSNDWVNLIGDGHDWLDKPHFPFWLIAASFKLFGINDFAYKLPAFISFLIGALYCYQLAKKLYDTATARVATIILITSLHLFLSVFDVRAEAYLTTFIIAATFHLYQSLEHKISWHIVWAAVFCAAACMTKGIFVLITIAGGFIIYWLYNKQWKELWQPKWWLLIVLTFIFISPELYCLYQQFDLHPEKIVFGTTHVSGIKFFFWDSQFGRFFNSGPIKGEGDISFFLHTFLWAFLPWALIAYAAIFYSFKKLNKTNSKQLIFTGSIVITFLLFSLSKFQLPHYIVILFPHFAIVSAVYLLGIQKEKTLKSWNIVQGIVFLIAIIAISSLAIITRFNPLPWPFVLVLVVTSIFLFLFKGNNLIALLGKSVCFATVLFIYLNLFFYPALLLYQGGTQAGKYMKKNMPTSNAIMYNCSAYSFELYAPKNVLRSLDSVTLQQAIKTNNPLIVFTTAAYLPSLKKEAFFKKEIARFQTYPVSQLSLPFLNAGSREKELDYFVLVECEVK
jgi:4-amino-4-deoxy-L-arabinose transferase-like glycosyltransferase